MSKTERIYRLNRLLQNRRVISRRELQETLEVSAATLTRDIEFMRSRMNAPWVVAVKLRECLQGVLQCLDRDCRFAGEKFTALSYHATKS